MWSTNDVNGGETHLEEIKLVTNGKNYDQNNNVNKGNGMRYFPVKIT